MTSVGVAEGRVDHGVCARVRAWSLPEAAKSLFTRLLRELRAPRRVDDERSVRWSGAWDVG